MTKIRSRGSGSHASSQPLLRGSSLFRFRRQLITPFDRVSAHTAMPDGGEWAGCGAHVAVPVGIDEPQLCSASCGTEFGSKPPGRVSGRHEWDGAAPLLPRHMHKSALDRSDTKLQPLLTSIPGSLRYPVMKPETCRHSDDLCGPICAHGHVDHGQLPHSDSHHSASSLPATTQSPS